jgi:hypothetical protein
VVLNSVILAAMKFPAEAAKLIKSLGQLLLFLDSSFGLTSFPSLHCKYTAAVTSESSDNVYVTVTLSVAGLNDIETAQIASNNVVAF